MATSLSQDMHVPPRWKSVQALGTDPKVWSSFAKTLLRISHAYHSFHETVLLGVAAPVLGKLGSTKLGDRCPAQE